MLSFYIFLLTIVFLILLVECSVVLFHSTLADLTLFVLYSEMLKFSNYFFNEQNFVREN